ncbi:MAG: hypothetical protein PW789_08655 [Edaphobacter sp.]|uniref:hypothetical protein n=1 Tax=Edaphobacter sp. TaxID=1934404 RepID=UPI002395AA89|nr:hypothetical protein [Edaphobacter sp.]MDE1176665.1 hypothetical protein [Edaphobacter sp.]
MSPLIEIALTQPGPESLWVTFFKSILPGIVAALGIIAAFTTYRQNSRVQASNLLLKLEEHFNQLGSKLFFLEYPETCYAPIAPILSQCMTNPDSLHDDQRKLIMDVDECIRFLYICALNAPDTLHFLKHWPWKWLGSTSRLPHAYMYYLRQLNDRTDKPVLYSYVRKYFPTMSDWLDRNRAALEAQSMPR